MTIESFKTLAATDVADASTHDQVMDIGIQAILSPAQRIVGPAFTVRCENASNSWLHDAIYSAPKGSVIVASADGCDYAVAGGNVCAIAQQNGVAGFVIDGVVRDLGEIREAQFPVYARGVYPKPGKKSTEGASQISINCGGVTVNPGDIIIADEEGIVVVPADNQDAILQDALAKKVKADQQTLEEWTSKHRKKIAEVLGKTEG